MPEQTKLLLTIIGMTLLSGLGDSQGFLHAARTWRNGQLVWSELAKSTLGFAFGIVMYWAAIPFLRQAGVFSAEAQTILWFGITMVGIATFSGRFFQWAIVDQSIAVMVLGGISWLLFHTAEQ